jgi:hypothetical protein
MFIGMGMPIPDLANLPGVSRPGKPGGGGGLESIANNFSMQFNGVDEYFVASGTAQSGDFTLSFWVNASSTYTNATQYVPAGIRPNVYPNRTIGRMYKFPNANGLTLMSQMRGPDGSSGSFDNYYTAGFDFTTKGWVYVAFTYDSITRRVYVYLDGQAKQWTKFTGGTTSDYITTVPSDNYNNDLDIGAYNGSSLFFPGYVDEVAVFDYGLEASDIQNIYDITNNDPTQAADLSTLSTAPIAWYRMGD